MANPVEAFLLEKKALNLGGMANRAKPLLGRAAEGAATGVLAGAGVAGFAGLVGAAGKLYDAATKTRDFNNMLEANPHLQEHLREDPAHFNRLYTSLRTLAPDFAKEPMVAGSYMFQALNTSRESAGMSMVGAQRDVRSKQQSPLSEAAVGGFMKGMGDRPEGKKPQLMGQKKTTMRLGANGEATPDREEVSQNFYG